MINEEKQQQIDEFYSAIGFNLSGKGSHLGLLVGKDEKKYYKFLLETVPNVSNIDVISIANLACLMATFKKLNGYINRCENNIELYLKLVSKRAECVTKIDMVLKSYGLTGSTRDKLIIPYKIEEQEDGDE